MKEKPLTIKEFASLGGKASANSLTPEQRSARARKAGKKGGWPKGKPRKIVTAETYQEDQEINSVDIILNR